MEVKEYPRGTMKEGFNPKTDRYIIRNRSASVVKCEVCNEEIHTTAAVCKVGHAVCLDCENGPRCPICTEPRLSKRFIMMNQMIEALEDKEHFLETISEQLECPICYEDVSMVGWRNCTQGHAVCLGCRKKTICCPLCRSAYSPFQCTALVHMLKELKKTVKCKYHHNGCKKAYLKGNQLFDHEKTCKYTDATCMVKGCSWAGGRNKLNHHFKQKHQGLITDGENQGRTSGVRSTSKLVVQEQKISYMAMMHYAIGGACILGGCYSVLKSHL